MKNRESLTYQALNNRRNKQHLLQTKRQKRK